MTVPDANGCIKIPRCIGRLAVMETIGRGAMGVVVKGWDPFIERYVAIKIPLPSREVLAESGGYSHKFFREAQTAGKLSHPNIVSIYDADMCGPFCYLAMEYIDGAPLSCFCEPKRMLSVDKALAIVFNTCRALDYAHNRGVIHRDIKPANIMLTKAGAVKITDFSIAKMSHDAMKTMIADAGGFGIKGTLRFMSPEHFTGDMKVDARSDIFSLGCVLYELLTGTPAFQGTNTFNVIYKITSEEPATATDLRPDLPQIIKPVIAKALSKDPDQRYPSCMDFAYDLSVVMRHLKRESMGETTELVSDYFTHIGFFREFTQAQFQQILQAGQALRIKRGCVVVSEGEVDDALFILLSGKVEVIKGGIRIDTIDRGECFGEMAYLAGAPRAATIRALTDCILLKISAALMDRVPPQIQILFLKSFAKTAVDRIGKNHQLILEMAEKLERRNSEVRSQHKNSKSEYRNSKQIRNSKFE